MEDRIMILTAVGNVISDWLKRYDLIWSSRLGRFEQNTVTRSNLFTNLSEARLARRAERPAPYYVYCLHTTESQG